jgi:hypothetical protein
MADWSRNDVNQVFSSALGRLPTQDEMSFLSDYLDHGHITPYQIGQYLQGTPEAQQARLGQYGKAYEGQLAQNDQTILNRAADVAQGQFAQQGRQFSSGQGNAILQAGQNLAMDRNSALSAFYGQGYQGLMGQYGQQGQGALERAYGLSDQARMRAWQIDDYNRQQNDFNSYLRGQGTRNLQQGLLGAGLALPGEFLGAAGQSKGFGKLFS